MLILELRKSRLDYLYLFGVIEERNCNAGDTPFSLFSKKQCVQMLVSTEDGCEYLSDLALYFICVTHR